MAVKATQSLTVTTTATKLCSVGQSTVLMVLVGATTVYLGDSTVTAATGFPWTSALGPLTFDLGSGEVLYGITASGTSTIALLETEI